MSPSTVMKKQERVYDARRREKEDEQREDEEEKGERRTLEGQTQMRTLVDDGIIPWLSF